MTEKAPRPRLSLWQRAMILASLDDFSTGVHAHWTLVSQDLWPAPGPARVQRTKERLIGGLFIRMAKQARHWYRTLRRRLSQTTAKQR